MPLYNVNTQSALDRSQQSLSESIRAAGNITKKGTHTEEEKTAGGAMLSAVSMGASGAVAGSALAGAAEGGMTGSAGGWWGAAIGAIVGLGAYLLS